MDDPTSGGVYWTQNVFCWTQLPVCCSYFVVYQTQLLVCWTYFFVCNIYYIVCRTQAPVVVVIVLLVVLVVVVLIIVTVTVVVVRLLALQLILNCLPNPTSCWQPYRCCLVNIKLCLLNIKSCSVNTKSGSQNTKQRSLLTRKCMIIQILCWVSKLYVWSSKNIVHQKIEFFFINKNILTLVQFPLGAKIFSAHQNIRNFRRLLCYLHRGNWNPTSRVPGCMFLLMIVWLIDHTIINNYSTYQ